MQIEEAEAAVEVSAEGEAQTQTGAEAAPEAGAAEQAAGEAAGEEQVQAEEGEPASEGSEAKTYTADEVAKLEHGLHKSRERVERQRDELKAELEQLRARAAELEAKANVSEEQKLIDEAQDVQEAIGYLNGNRAAWVRDVQAKYPSLSDEQVDEMYRTTRENLVAKALTTNMKLTQAALKSRGTQNVNTAATTTAARAAAPVLKAAPKKPSPTVLNPQGAGAAGGGLRGPAVKPSVAKVLADAGGTDDPHAVAKAMEAFTMGRAI